MTKHLIRSFSVLIILVIVFGQIGATSVAAAENFIVNSTADMVDANPGDGLCETDVTGDCTLRAAIQEANALEGTDTISIPAGTYTLAMSGAGENAAASGDLDITGDVTITGAGMAATIVDAGNLDRAFHVLSSLEISDLTIQNGLADPGGAILVSGDASITHVEFRNNQATSETTAGTGGAVHVSAEGSVDVIQSRFINNFAYFGGGALASSVTTALTITDSTFDSNSTTLGGGALYPNGDTGTIANSTFVNNSADTGGAIHSNADAVSISNSTFVGNSAVNHGAIDSRIGTISVNNSTFSNNTASGIGDSLGDQPGQGGDIQVGNSILSGTDLNNCGGTVVDLGNNVSWPSDNNCPGLQDDPRLDSLADNGGLTQTVALLTGSPAVDAGNNESCTATDQRGVTRPQGEACDIGAFESALVNIFSVTNTNDSGAGSLRQAILSANAAANSINGLDEIHFNIPGTGVHTIAPASVLPAITEPVIIDGYTQPGASPNTLAIGNDADILIALDGDTCAGLCAQALLVSAGSSMIKGLAVHGNFNNGIELNGSGSTVAGNFFGLRADGTANGVIASGVYINNTSSNTVGGNAPADRNVISNNRDGVFIAAGVTDATNNIMVGNYIGTNPAGTAAQGNTQRGVFVGGFGQTASSNSITGNLISGNGHFGILLRDAGVTGNLVVSNRIGTTASGSAGLPNGGSESADDGLAGTNARAGVYIAGANNTIGGTGLAANTIAFNAGTGVTVIAGTGSAIRANLIFSNNGLDIDLGGDGVTFNHAGLIPGPNTYQNYPVLSLATTADNTTRVGGMLESEPNQTYTIDVFANEICHPSFFGGGAVYLGSFPVATDASGLATFDEELSIGTTEPFGVTATATGSNGTSEFSYCRPSSTPNLNWVQAQSVSGTSLTQQFITDRFQEKWFKFPVQPGSTVTVQLTSLPGSAVSLHRDPLPIYNGLINPQNSAVLSAEAADAAFLPSGSLPSGSLPSGSLPSGSLPSGSLPSGSLPTGYLPSGSLPSGSLPSGSLPSGSLPSGSLPSGSLPSGSLPSGSLPSGSLPSGSLPSGSLPSGSLPSGSLPSGSLPSGSLPSGSLDAYASAARRSLLGISMDPYATVQTIERNTYDLRENLYVRVVGPYSIETPFTLEVAVAGGVCSAVQAVPASLPVISGSGPASGSFRSLILTDSSRLLGTSTEIADALANLATLAGRSDVTGAVIDFADASRYPRIAFANTEADDTPTCPSAKNTVADEIKEVIDAYRSANSTVEYIVLAGGADVIPFFQVPDVSGLANEKEYVVPVAPSTPSEAGLESNLVQGQDGYGSRIEFTQAGHTLALPDLAVGRLVDTASDISAAVNAYIQTGGVVAPNSALVTGYDFVGDAAVAIKAEMDAGTNSSSDTLIQPPGEPPTGPNAWTAAQLRTKLLSGNFDIAVLSGHFSAGNLLAADYTSELTAAEIAQSTTDLTDVLVLALGCHGGYTIPNSDRLPGVSPEPDWAKAFLRKGAAGYISATGYAYGDTELTEYGERLFLLMAQQLRTGSGPISIGQAVVKAKQQYLAETAQLTGIDHKTIVEMTLYGLPMMKIDMPGARLNPPTENSIVGSTTPVDSGPGADVGLSTTTVALNPSLTTQTVPLQNLANGSTVITTYLSGPDGVVANPFEPIFPKAIYNVTSNGNVLRGVALRGGTYTDLDGIVPLTSAPTTETSTAHLSYNTDVFYPTQTWSPNFYEAVSGGNTRLVVFPAQFKSSAPGAIDGILRTFDEMNLELYYLPANWTAESSSAVTKAAGVSAAPTILGASALEDGNTISFSVNAAAEGSAGVQEVWVLYTGKPGSSLHGTWTSLNLGRNSEDPTLWQAALTLPSGTTAQDILFMVQAVGGAGLTTLATNLGAFYSITPEDAEQLPPPSSTTITLQSPPADGIYLKERTFNVQLQSEGQPLAGQFVTLDIGGQQTFATTDSSGEATLSLTLVIPPGDYTVQASFRGNAQYLGSNDARPFAVNKDSTMLLATTCPQNENQAPTQFFVALCDSSGRPLGGKSVFFIVRNNANSLVTTVIADFQGNAVLGELPLPPGTYSVDAYFSGNIPVSSSQTLHLSDDYYESSSLTGLSFRILYDFQGFFDPVKNPPVVNQVNAGRSVPIKFSLGGNQGLAIFAAGFPQSRQVQCDSFSPIDPVESTLTSGSSSLSYDPATGMYTYIWKTERSWAGTCRQFSIRLVDGQTYTLNFRFIR